MLLLSELAPIGVIRKTHGFKGEVKISIYPEAEELEPEFLMLKIEGKPVPFKVAQISGMSDDWTVKFEDINDDQTARRYLNCTVLVPKDEIDAPDIPHDISGIIGFQIADRNLGNLGVITDFIPRQEQPLIEMQYLNQVHLIPVHPDIILQIDDQKKVVHTNLPDGLLSVLDN